jgi:hypothetical protein
VIVKLTFVHECIHAAASQQAGGARGAFRAVLNGLKRAVGSPS